MATYNVKVAWRGESVHEVEADNAKDAAEKVMGPGGEMDSGCFEIDYPSGPRLAGVWVAGSNKGGDGR